MARTLTLLLVAAASVASADEADPRPVRDERDDLSGEWQVFRRVGDGIVVRQYKITPRSVVILQEGKVVARSTQIAWDDEGRMVAIFREGPEGVRNMRRISCRGSQGYVELWGHRWTKPFPRTVWYAQRPLIRGDTKRDNPLEQELKWQKSP